MLNKTRGVVLHTIAYNDSHDIVHIYTESFGRIPYFVRRKPSRKSMTPRALFMPLMVLDMEVKHLATKEIQQIREARSCFSGMALATHPIKNAIALFLAEVLYRTLRNRTPDEPLFRYLYDSIRWLNLSEEGFANFHLVFLIHLLRYLGIYPNEASYQVGAHFDLLNGVFVQQPLNTPHSLNREESLALYRLLRMNYENMAIHTFSRHERTAIIQHLLDYYRIHLTDFSTIKSLDVMQRLFD